MPDSRQEQVTQYLHDLEHGDSSAVDRLLPHVYEDLRGLAERAFRDQWRNHTLQPTALVHEACVRLVKPSSGGADGWQSRQHFLRVAALAMRQLSTDYARGRNAEKRHGSRERVQLEHAEQASEESSVDLAALDEALTELRALDERQASIVELRFLSGLTVEETAEVLGVSERTVYLDWNMARSWLERQLG